MSSRTHAAGRPSWTRLEELLSKTGRFKRRLPPDELAEMARLYRSACADAARLRSTGAEEGSVAYLDQLLAQAHNLLYRAPPARVSVPHFLLQVFPSTLRANHVAFWIASLAFVVPLLFGAAVAAWVPDFPGAFLGEGQREMMRHMYSRMPEEARTAGEGSQAVSFYVRHNTTIAFQCFALGIFFGVGSLFVLVFNGLAIGTIFGLLMSDGKGVALWTFVSGHGAWELTAIVIAGAAGLRMGWSLVESGGRSRSRSLRETGPEVVRLVLGAAVMLAVAAAIEGLWSPSMVPAPVKWSFGILQCVVVGGWLTLCGREAGGRSR